ncbi:MAG: cytochrome c oxidase subunit II [Proteobacteria bacterium]|nr:cytochrome c oxidase subunit II [Pseudomonadota bacterium]
MWNSRILVGVVAVAASVMALAGFAAAQGFEGGSTPWQMGLREAASPTMSRIDGFHDFLLVIITVITLIVTALMAYIMIRFRASKNPNPSHNTHNTLLEVLWTVVPIIILVVIAVPSFRLLYFVDRTAEAEMTLKTIGNQWFWSYEYPDHDNLTFDAVFVEDADLEEGQVRLLTTDVDLVLPVDTNIRILTTATDVIHAFALPNLGLKLDAVPGRINETWVRIEREGVYYGMCSELCGSGHGFMPIMLRALSKADYAKWVEEAKERYAYDGKPGAPRDAVAARAEKARQIAARFEETADARPPQAN